MQVIDFHNVHAMIRSIVDAQPELTAFQWFTDNQGGLAGVSWRACYDQIKQVSKSLIKLGVQKGDKVGIISNTCYQWSLTDFGIICAGACTIGIYQSNMPGDCEYIINHSDAVIVFIEDGVQLAKLRQIRDQIPAVRKVVMFREAVQGEDWIISFDEFLKLGTDVSDEEFVRRSAEPEPQDPATIVYTSGTTGLPKGAVITQDNLTYNSQAIKSSAIIEAGDQTILFLPLAHIMARLTVYTAALAFTTVTFARSLNTAVEDISFVRPHWIPSVPRVFEKIYAKVLSGAEAKGGIVLKLFNWACRIGYVVADCRADGKPIPTWISLQYAIASKLVFSKLQAGLGGRIRWMLSGGAPLNDGIIRFFHAAGVMVMEGIGMTENASFSHTNRLDAYRFGTVGQPGPGIEHKLAEDGEIMIRGRNVMKEYYKMPEETKKTFTADGWLLTGDLGTIDKDGFLTVTGRKKEIIITAGGKNIAPARVEGILGKSTYIAQVMVVGDRRKYLTAVVTLDLVTVEEYARANNIMFSQPEELINHPDIVALVNAEVQEKNKELGSFESVKKVVIVPEFTVENGLITPTLKLKKNLIQEKYTKLIDELYMEN